MKKLLYGNEFLPIKMPPSDFKHFDMKKLLLLAAVSMILVSVTFILASEEEIFEEAEKIIQDKISCNELSDYQLEILGDYFMEQMHPGELHEIMDERMGGEGSENLRQVHINMGKMFYCGEQTAMPMGMMNMMMGRGGGMMSAYPLSYYESANSSMFVFSILFSIVIIILFILFIVWLIKQINQSERKK